jgi:hypothetical protein
MKKVTNIVDKTYSYLYTNVYLGQNAPGGYDESQQERQRNDDRYGRIEHE